MTSNNSNNSTSGNSNNTLSPNHQRCRVCGHDLFRCSICKPLRVYHGAGNKSIAKPIIKARGKAYCHVCAKLKEEIELAHDSSPDDEENLDLRNYISRKIEAANQLRCYLLETSTSKQNCGGSEKCHELPSILIDHASEGLGLQNSSTSVFHCQTPHDHNLSTLYLLEAQVQHVYTNIRRLVMLLSSNEIVDVGILRTVLRSLLSQLAVLHHRVFPDLALTILPSRKAFHLMLVTAHASAQVAYKGLWAAALHAGLLRSACGRTEATGREINPSCDADVQFLLWRARELADELRLCLALIRAGEIL